MKRKSAYHKMSLGLAGLLLMLLGRTAAFAEPALASTMSPLDQKAELAVTKADPGELFATLGKMMGVEAEVDPGVSGKVSVELHNVRVRTLLDAVCESVGCRWTMDSSGTKLRVVPDPTAMPKSAPCCGKDTAPKDPIDLKVNKADAQELLNTFGQIMGAKVILDPAIKGKISLILENTPVDKALNAVCSAAGCDWTYDAESRVLRVTAQPTRPKGN
jgi:type II secretory pathway component GspD/PulD (secretin)